MEATAPLEDRALAQFTIFSADGLACNPQALVADIQGCKLPRYVFPDHGQQPRQEHVAMERVVVGQDASSDATSGSSDDDDAANSDGPPGPLQQAVTAAGLLDSMILALWDNKFAKGLFKYDVSACPTKLLPGSHGFIAQLNEGRASKKRPTEFKMDHVVQAFDEGRFNFTKAFMQEVLFEFSPQPGCEQACLQEAAPASSSPHLVVINVSPIDYGHVLLVPRALDGLPQLVDPDTLLLALQFASQAANPHMRVAYNSLGAYASVNHLHFQAYFQPAPFAVERVATAPLPGSSGDGGALGSVSVRALSGYPVRGFVFESGGRLAELAAVAGGACQALQRLDQPHNLFISDQGRRVFLYPQCYAAKQARGEVAEDLLATGVNPAVFEISGHQVMFRAQDYVGLTQEVVQRMLAEVSLGEQEFAGLARALFPALYAAQEGAAGSWHGVNEGAVLLSAALGCAGQAGAGLVVAPAGWGAAVPGAAA